jgi:predicted Zn-dependent peptidase
MTVWIKTGSRDEQESVGGISHFLEHMVFKGSNKYPSAKIVSEVIDGMGAENNAGTSKEWTNFWIKTASINIDNAFDVLADVVLHPLLKSRDINKERNVILEEIAMYEDTPIMSIGEEFESLVFKDSPLGRKIAGNKDTLERIDRRAFEQYRNERYYSENILISMAGGVSFNKALELAKRYFIDVPNKKTKAVTQKTDAMAIKRGKLSSEDRVFLKTKHSDQAHIMFGFLMDGWGYKGKYAQSLLSAILGRGMSSRLFTEVREKQGLAYAVRSGIERYREAGVFSVYAGVNPGKAEEAVKVIQDELYKLSRRKKEISKKELNKAKNYIKGRLALGFEDSSAVGDFFAEQAMFEKSIDTPKTIYDKLDKVGADEIYLEASRIFDEKQSFLAIIGPYDEKDVFLKVLGES